MFKKIVIAVGVLVVALLAYAATRPDTFLVERTGTIKAAPEAIFPYLNDFRKGEAWSPYEKKDPAMKRIHSGPDSGKGSVYDFAGNKEVGSGRLEILDSVPPSKVVIALEMREPFAGGRTIIEYRLEPQENGTKFTWSMQGNVPFLGKIICVFVSMDKMMGKDFEAGIASLKAVVESK